MFGLVVMEVMTLSGHLSNINEIYGTVQCIDSSFNEIKIFDSHLWNNKNIIYVNSIIVHTQELYTATDYKT
jgi:hypothetical protein